MTSHRVANGVTLRIALGALVCGAMFGGRPANVAAAGEWLTGPSLQKRLSKPVDVLWPGNPLRKAIENLSRTEEVAVLIDRRVDPQRKVSLRLERVPLAAALQEIARRQELGCCLLGPVAYFGPPRVAARLRTLSALRTEEARHLPAEAKARLLQLKPMAWNDLAVPRALLAQLTHENGLVLSGLERVPHDLWAAADLPPLSLVDRLTLIAAQFDLTFQAAPDGKSLALLPLPDDVAIERSYDGGRQPQAVAEQYAALAPGAQIRVVGDKVFVKGLLEEHEQITASRKPAKRPGGRQPSQDAGTTHIDKMTVKEAPVGQVLQELAGKLNLDLKIDHQALQAAGISLEKRVSLSVQDVTVDELLQEVAKAAQLRVRRQGSVVEIGPGRQ
jgi:hypothetical protein